MRTSTKHDLLAITALHAIVRKHVDYCRVYSEKRSSDLKLVVLGHRIKYYLCNPTPSIMALLNRDLKAHGLYAKRITTYWGKNRAGPISLVLMRI